MIIAYFSTFEQPGWKSAFLKQIVDRVPLNSKFDDSIIYAIGSFRAPRSERYRNFRIKRFMLPYYIETHGKLVLGQRARLFAEQLFGFYVFCSISILVLLRRDIRTGPKLAFLAPRPHLILRLVKFLGFRVILDVAESSPSIYRPRLIEERRALGLSGFSFYASSFVEKQTLKSVKKADVLFFPRQYCANTFKGYLNSSQILFTCPYPLDQAFVRRDKNSDISQSIWRDDAVISLAHHSVLKGTMQLIRAFDEGIIRGNLFLIGPVDKDIKFLVSGKKFKNVTFLGYQDVGSILPYFNGVAAMLSMSEGYSRSVYETVSNGIPTVVTEAAWIPEFADLQILHHLSGGNLFEAIEFARSQRKLKVGSFKIQNRYIELFIRNLKEMVS